MRVDHIVRQFNPAVGGLEDAVLNIARRQRDELGVDTRVVTLDRIFGHRGRLPKHDVVEGVPVLRLPWRGSTRYPLAPSVLVHLASADLLHVHAIDFFFDFLALTRFLHKKPMVASTHGGFFHSRTLARLKRLWFATVTSASATGYRRIVACSHSDAALFNPIAAARLVVIENGINQEKFAACSASKPSQVIVSFGRFARHKRLDLLFPLLARLRQHDAAWRLVIAGRDADQTHDQLHAMALAAGVRDAVQIVVDPTDRELRSLISQTSYFACLSEHEGFGLAAVEALSAGLLPILSSIEPFRRLVSVTKCGLLVDPDDVAGTAAAIVASHITTPQPYEERRLACIRASSLYDWKTVAAAYRNLYDDVLKTAPAGLARPVTATS